MNCIVEPQCSEKPVFVGAKVGVYGKDQAITVSKYSTLIVVQNGALAGTIQNDSGEEIRVTLEDKRISGLKKGMFAKEYKDVMLYWYHIFCVPLTYYDMSATTARKNKGFYAFSLRYDFDKFLFPEFAAMLKGLKVDPNSNTLILTHKQFAGALRNRVEEVMPAFLDTCPSCKYVSGERNMPKLTPVINEVAKVAKLFGLAGKIEVS